MRIRWACLALGVLWSTPALGGDVYPGRGVPTLVKARCVKCHGPAKREGKLNLATPEGLGPRRRERRRRGPGSARGEPALGAGRRRRDAPQGAPLGRREGRAPPLDRRAVPPACPQLAPGRPRSVRPLGLRDARGRSPRPWSRDRCVAPAPTSTASCWRRLEASRAQLRARGRPRHPHPPRQLRPDRPAADPRRGRRVPGDARPDAYERMVERYLASPRYGERWGSTGSTPPATPTPTATSTADTDRPLAYRYRDYVIRVVERGQAVRPLRPRATRRRRAGRASGRAARSRPRRSTGSSPPTSSATRPTAPARATATPTNCVPTGTRCWKGTIADPRLVPVRPDLPVRPLPRPQVRADHPEGLLRAPRDPLARLPRRSLGQAERADRRGPPPGRARGMGGPAARRSRPTSHARRSGYTGWVRAEP